METINDFTLPIQALARHYGALPHIEDWDTLPIVRIQQTDTITVRAVDGSDIGEGWEPSPDDLPHLFKISQETDNG